MGSTAQQSVDQAYKEGRQRSYQVQIQREGECGLRKTYFFGGTALAGLYLY